VSLPAAAAAVRCAAVGQNEPLSKTPFHGAALCLEALDINDHSTQNNKRLAIVLEGHLGVEIIEGIIAALQRVKSMRYSYCYCYVATGFV
jgi:hypothetical protein